MFSGCTVSPDSKETELGSSDQESSPLEVRSSSYFWWCGYVSGPWMSFITTDEFPVRVTKTTSRLVSHDLRTYRFIFNLFKLNELWPYYQKHVN